MQKRTLIILSALFVALLVLSTTAVFANTDTSDKMKSGISNAGNTVVDGAERLGNDIKSGINNVESGIENGTRDLMNNSNDSMNNDNDKVNGAFEINNGGKRDSDYTATRTSTDDSMDTGSAFDMTNPNTWVWILAAIAAVIVVGLVIYAVTQPNGRNNDE